MTDKTNTASLLLTAEQLRQAAGGAAYLKLGDIKGAPLAEVRCQNNLKQLALAMH